jgi:hypothetical protein
MKILCYIHHFVHKIRPRIGNTYVHILMCIDFNKINNNPLGCLEFDSIEKHYPPF